MNMRYALLAGSAALSLFLGTGGMAVAFDDVDWKWDAKVDTKVDIDVDVDAKFEPDGLVQVEKLQAQIGDVTAESVVKDVEFDPAVGDGGWGWDHKGGGSDPTVTLPAVISAATAVGNNQSITADVPVLLHDTQIVTGDPTGSDHYDPKGHDHKGYDPKGGGSSDFSDVLDGDLGGFEQADITATSLVAHIENAIVDSSATAVGNNISIDMQEATQAAGGGGWGGDSSNALLVADITQIDFADVTATSHVYGVKVSGSFDLPYQIVTDPVTGYDKYNPNGVKAPLVSSVATAVGNNVSINVSVPQP